MLYTTTFKAYNLELASSSIQLSDSAWIEQCPDFSGAPSFEPSLLSLADEHPQYGLSRFYQELVGSPVRLRTVHSADQQEENPFKLNDCAYVAIAIAINHDPWFVVGIESLSNNLRPDNPSQGPYSSFFNGRKGPLKVRKADESDLEEKYNFVYKTLTESDWDEDLAKLLLQALKCIAKPPYQQFPVLKLGLGHLFTDWDSTILSAALFLENLLTTEGRGRSQGLREWNEIYTTSVLDESLVELVFQYRNLVVHSNATCARSRVAAWRDEGHLSEEDAITVIAEFIFMTAKRVLRAISSNDIQKWQDFKRRRP